MDMVSESGAITDVNEIAAALGLTPEVIKAEDEAVMATSLEDLLEAINQTEEMVAGEDVDIDVLTPAMESILNIANEIQGAGAISRADAITLRQMTTSLEGFQDLFATMPMNSFTEMPSKVNFDASMEGIFGDIGRKIVEFVKAIVKWLRERAKAFIGFFRSNRVKVKQTEEAAKKVDDALEASVKAMKATSSEIDEILASGLFTASANAQAADNISKTAESLRAQRAQFDELRRKLGEKNVGGWANGVKARTQASSFQLDVPMLATSLAYGSRSGGVAHAVLSLQLIAMKLGRNAIDSTKNDVAPGLIEDIVALDKKLFEESKLTKPDNTVDSVAKAIRDIVSRLREEAADVDVLTVSDPENEIRKIISSFNTAQLSGKTDTMGKAVITSSEAANKRITALEAEIIKANNAGEKLVENDERIVQVRRLKTIVKSFEDVEYIFTSIMAAFAKVTTIGGNLAKNPGSAKAA
jgi:hypothetical protein